MPPMSSTRSTGTARGGNALESFFKIGDRGSTLGREVRGGLVTFFTMAYIVVLNPLIIGTVKDGDGQYIGGGTDPSASIAKVAVATALVAGVMTILMGLVANYPLALATGLGLNAFVAFSIATKMTWADAMGLVVLEGLIILVLVLTGFRSAVFAAVPRELKVAISVGIGLFIAFIGVVDAGFVRRPAAPTAPPVELGVGGNLRGWPILVFVFGLALIISLYTLKVRGAILIGILSATVLAIVIEAIVDVGARTDQNPGGWGLTVPKLPDDWFTGPNFDILGEFSLFGSFDRISAVSAILLIFTLMLADFFDTMGTMTAIGAEAGLLDAQGTRRTRSASWSSTVSPPRPVVPPRCPATRPTSSRLRVSATARAPAWPAW
jgi:adenine/guanine/hypoxanthine permease